MNSEFNGGVRAWLYPLGAVEWSQGLKPAAFTIAFSTDKFAPCRRCTEF